MDVFVTYDRASRSRTACRNLRRTILSFELLEKAANTDTAGGLAQWNDSGFVNPAQSYLLSLGTDQSRRQMRRTLDRASRFFGYHTIFDCDWRQMRAVHLLAYKAKLEHEGKSPNTINCAIFALKGVAREAWGQQLIGDHDNAVIQAVKGSRGKRENRGSGRALQDSETDRLLADCDQATNAGKRDAVIIALGITAGLRRAEIASILIDDIRKADHKINIIGKGNKLRSIYVIDDVWTLLEKWLAVRGHRGIKNLFCCVRRGDHLDFDAPISGHAVYRILMRRAASAGVAAFTPHDLRRTFATNMFQAGADVNIVCKAMGHSSIATTQRYDKRTDAEVVRFARRLKLRHDADSPEELQKTAGA